MAGDLIEMFSIVFLINRLCSLGVRLEIMRDSESRFSCQS